MEFKFNRYYKATMNFSRYDKRDTAVEVLALYKKEGNFIVLCDLSEAHRSYLRFSMDPTDVITAEEIGLKYSVSPEFLPGLKIRLTDNAKFGTIINPIDDYRILIDIDGETVEVYDWEYGLCPSCFVDKRVVITRGDAAGITGEIAEIRTDKITFTKISRTDIDLSDVDITDLDFVVPITSNSYVKVKGLDTLSREFDAKRLTCLLKQKRGSDYMFVTSISWGNVYGFDSDSNPCSAPLSILEHCSERFDYSADIYRFGDIVFYRGYKGRAISQYDDFVLLMFDDEIPRNSDFNFGFNIDPRHLRWASASCAMLLERDDSFRLDKPSLSTSLTEAIKKLNGNKPKFSVGDRVTIRDCEDMKIAFGENDNGEPKTRCRFTSAMHHLCGRTATIKAIDNAGHITLEDWSDPDNTDFIFSTEFIVGGDTALKATRSDIENIVGDIRIGTAEDSFANIQLPLISYGIARNGAVYRIIANKYTAIIFEGDFSRELTSENFKGYDISCIIAATDDGRLPLNTCVANVIWENKPTFSVSDVELLTGVKITD